MRATVSLPLHKVFSSIRLLRLGALPFVLTLGAVHAGCGQRVVLGSECDDLKSPCDIQAETPIKTDDAGASDGETLPPSPDPDGGDTIVEPPSELQIENPKFERNGGIDGDLILQDLFESIFKAVVPSQPIFTSLPGWYSCVPFTVTSDSPSDPNAADGNYLTFVRNALTLSTPEFSAARQKLPVPMRAGLPVHLLVDVISRTEGDNNLYLEVRGDPQPRAKFITQCGIGGTVIGRSARIDDSSDWTSVCMSFTPTEDYYTLYLGPSTEGKSQASSPTLLLDTLRVVSECPAP